jgi:hypothetical protein
LQLPSDVVGVREEGWRPRQAPLVYLMMFQFCAHACEGDRRFSGSFAALRMTARTNNSNNNCNCNSNNSNDDNNSNDNDS